MFLDHVFIPKRSLGKHVDPNLKFSVFVCEKTCFDTCAIPSTWDTHIQLRRPQPYRVPNMTPHVLKQQQASHVHIPIAPFSNPKIRIADFHIFCKAKSFRSKAKYSHTTVQV